MDAVNMVPPLHNLPPQMYGIWLPGMGWWKLAAPGGAMVAYATMRRYEALHYAAWVGNGAKVFPVDLSLTHGERELLLAEKARAERGFVSWSKKTWHILTNLKNNHTF